MGTRADFYVGRGPEAKWLGSVAWDGYPEDILHDSSDEMLAEAHTELDFTAGVAVIASNRDDFTRPEQGWPWPWGTSSTTDYAYAWDNGLWISSFGGPWLSIHEAEVLCKADDADEYEENLNRPRAVFPDMSDKKNVTLGKRSGLMVFR
jgi:hypothetical protein